jgi:hypothetical protein
MCSIVNNANHQHSWLKNSITYEVPLSDGRKVYMRVDRTNYRNEDRSVVIVDGAKLLALWRAEPNGCHADVSSGSPETWPQDRKYPDAAEGFSFGIENPVPLAEIGCYVARQAEEVRERVWLFFNRVVRVDHRPIPYVTFTNGITRTIWLLTNGARAFPIEVASNEAENLQRYCGVIGSPMTVEDLVPRRSA